MGYEIEINIDLQVKKNKISELREKIKHATHNKRHDENFGRCYVEEFLEGMQVDNEGYIDLEEPYGNWDDYEGFIKFLLPYVKKGDITFKGEDGEQWGYHFDGKGKAYLMHTEWKTKKEPYFDMYKILLEKL